MTVTDRIRMGVVGVGSFGSRHALTLAGLAEAELVAVIDPNADHLAALRQQLPDVVAFDDLSKALREVDADGWVIATPTATHIPLARRILDKQQGAYLLIEKPLAPTTAAAKQLERQLADHPNQVMAGHIMLYCVEFRQLLAEIQQRPPLVYFHAVRHRPTNIWEHYQENPFRLTMVHDLYMTYAMVGGEEPTHISGRLHQRSDGGLDLALAHMEWANGTWATLTASYLTPPSMSDEGYDRVEVFGQGWAAKMHINPQPLEIWSEKTEYPLSLNVFADPVAPSGWLAEELRHFCRVIRGVAEPPLGARYSDALRIQHWLEQLESSAKKRN